MKPPGPFLFSVAIQLPAIVEPNIRADAVVMAMVAAMLPTDIMAVDPMMTVVGPMARHPDHFPFAVPVTRPMAVIWPVTDFDAKSRLSLENGPESKTRYDERNEQSCFLNHIN